MTEYPTFKFSDWLEGQHFESDNYAWDIKTIWAAAAGLPVYSLPVIGIPTGHSLWDGVDNYMGFLRHTKLVMEADLRYPIIMCPDGNILDGRHRLGKAIITGKTHIKVQRLVTMPDPDFVIDGDTLKPFNK